MNLISKIEEGYFSDLGITTIELMPVNEFEGGWSWGYNPTFYMAPESSYGSPDDLKNLIKTQIKNQYQSTLETITKKKILEQIEKSHNIELPENLVEQETKIITQNFKKEEIEKNKKEHVKLAKSRQIR